MWQKLLALSIAILGFNFFFYNAVPVFSLGSLGFLLLIFIFNLVTQVAYFENSHTLKRKVAYACSILAVMAAGLSVLRDNSVDQFYLWLASWTLSFVGWYLLALIHHNFGALSELFMVPLQLGFGWVFSAIDQLSQTPSWWNKLKAAFGNRSLPAREVRINPRVFSGLLIALPVVLVITALLRSADPIFSSVINDLFSFDINITWPTWISDLFTGRVIANIILVILVLPAITLLLKDQFKSPFRKPSWGKFSIEASMVVGSLALILGLFLAIQFRYLFASVPETQLHQFGIQTYSEYVRKGFSELLIVAGLIYGVVGLSLGVLRMTAKEPKFLRTLNLVLLGEGLVFILSIFRRVLLYQADHGLTRVRMYGSVFLVVLIALTVVLILRHLVKKRMFWAAIEVGVIICGLFLGVILNVDRMIATTFKPTVNHEVDYVYISKLSADGLDGWMEAYQHSLEVINNPEFQGRTEFTDDEARRIVYALHPLWNLEDKYLDLVAKYGTQEERLEARTLSGKWVKDLPSSPNSLMTNFSELRAYEFMTQYMPFSQLTETRLKGQALYNLLSDQQKARTYDRSFDTPLL